MYAIIETGGLQFKVENGLRLTVPRLHADEGGKILFDRVLLLGGEGEPKVGTPTVASATVAATVVRHLRGPKIDVYHRKRRKGHEKKTGHRQEMTEIQITAISGS